MMEYHLTAAVSWLAPKDGGRSSVFNGYRGQFHHLGRERIADVEFFFPTDDVTPRTESICKVRFGRPEIHLPQIVAGDHFEVREGKRVIGKGRVVSIEDSDAI